MPSAGSRGGGRGPRTPRAARPWVSVRGRPGFEGPGLRGPSGLVLMKAQPCLPAQNPVSAQMLGVPGSERGSVRVVLAQNRPCAGGVPRWEAGPSLAIGHLHGQQRGLWGKAAPGGWGSQSWGSAWVSEGKPALDRAAVLRVCQGPLSCHTVFLVYLDGVCLFHSLSQGLTVVFPGTTWTEISH